MRFLFRMGVIALAIGCEILSAQQPELPKPETQDATPSPAGANDTPSPTPDLIPPDILGAAERAASPAPPPPTLPALSQLDEAFKEKPVSAAAGTAEKHAEWRDLKNRVVNDEKIRAARRAVNAARTDLEKRILLRRYYEILYDEVLALAIKPDLKAYVLDRKKDQLNTLPQLRVRPTPIPKPTPSPIPTPLPPKIQPPLPHRST